MINKWQHGAVVSAPFGWIVDGTRRYFSIATIYQRGLSYEEAVERGEFIYASIFPFDDNIRCWTWLPSRKPRSMQLFYPEGPDGGEQNNRKISEQTRNRAVFTPEQVRSRNLRKLEYILETMIPANFIGKSSNDLITARESRIHETASNIDKANLLIEIAEIYAEDGRADRKENESRT
ncbi:MAG: hypothetical protein IPN69_03870 [Acidobacteria bacterium]|nr:hypothetical protein [Acidobacteriota bacterium]